MITQYRAVLSIPGCARVYATALLGRLPEGMSSLAILLLVRAATHSYPAAGLAVGAYAFATAAAAPSQGRLVDRFGRRSVLVPLAAAQAGLLGALVLAARRGAPAAALIVLAALAGMVMPAIGPSVRALLGEVTTDRALRESAYAFESVAQELIWIAGPMVVAAAVAVASPSLAVLLCGLCCMVGTVRFVGSPLARGRGPHAPIGDTVPTRAAALAIPALRVLLAPLALMGAAIGGIDVGLPSLALHAGSRPSSGLLLALWSLGSLSGGVWYGSRSWHAPLAQRYCVLMAAAVLCTAPLIVARTIPEGIIASLLAGVTTAPAFSCLYALIGRVVTAGVETEAFTWASSALIIGFSAGSSLGGATIGAVGVSGPFVLSCAASALAAGLAVRARHRVGAAAA